MSETHYLNIQFYYYINTKLEKINNIKIVELNPLSGAFLDIQSK